MFLECSLNVEPSQVAATLYAGAELDIRLPAEESKGLREMLQRSGDAFDFEAFVSRANLACAE
eukprot:3281024-Pyramimonas_sp.AAC.1